MKCMQRMRNMQIINNNAWTGTYFGVCLPVLQLLLVLRCCPGVCVPELVRVPGVRSRQRGIRLHGLLGA